jgi:hypothetical protein
MDLSLAGLIGAIVGIIASAALYVPLLGILERAVRKWAPAAEERTTSAQEIALLRRVVLAVDMLVCGGIGYWIGQKIGG